MEKRPILTVDGGEHVVAVVVSAATHHIALEVDEVMGDQEVLVKPLGSRLLVVEDSTAARGLLRTAREFCRDALAAVLLSGIGRGGVHELLDLKHCGAPTFGQDKASAFIYGMPGVALELDAARYVTPPEEIGATLASIVGQGAHRG